MTTAAATQFLPVVAAAGAARDSLVVSIHDIAPSSRAVVEKILAELEHWGVRVCSLLVVPDYHRAEPMTEDQPFLSWLHRLESQGHEVVIHGYFHSRPRKADESLEEKLITRFYTRDEGEFFDLPYEEAFRRITKAYEAFRQAGLSPVGFIAPAWLLGAEGERAARDAGMEYTTRLREVTDLRSGDNFVARSLVYSVQNKWRRAASLVWNLGAVQMTRSNALLRLSIHPPDYAFPAIWSQIKRFTTGMTAARTSTTYRDWVAEQRKASEGAE